MDTLSSLNSKSFTVFNKFEFIAKEEKLEIHPVTTGTTR